MTTKLIIFSRNPRSFDERDYQQSEGVVAVEIIHPSTVGILERAHDHWRSDDHVWQTRRCHQSFGMLFREGIRVRMSTDIPFQERCWIVVIRAQEILHWNRVDAIRSGYPSGFGEGFTRFPNFSLCHRVSSDTHQKRTCACRPSLPRAA